MPTETSSETDIISKIIAYEGGEMPQEDVEAFFIELRDSGMLWHLQGCYQRAAMALGVI